MKADVFSSKNPVNTSDYQTIIACLEQNVPSFVHLDFSKLSLTLPQLEEIAAKIQNNNFIGNVSWGKMPNASSDIVQKIESKIILNNQNYKHHPTDFLHGLFSLHAYIDSTENDIVKFVVEKESNEKVKIRNEQLKDWKVFKIFNKPEVGRYYAVAYINEKTKQIVFAYRGTTFEKLDLLKTNSPFKAHFKSILGGQIVAQQAAAYEATGEITKYAEENNYNLSFTGHSLGAWLAELSLYFAHQDFHYPKAKAITFDSPGSAKIMDSFKPNVHSYKTDFDTRILNITTYLSAPNFVNVCNPHIHKAYRLFPEITPKHTGKIINILNKTPLIKHYTPLLEGILSLSGYLLDPMLDAFDPKTGKPIKYQQILDWPRIEYNPKDNTLINKALDFIPLASNLIYKNATATTFGSFLEVIDQLISGNIATGQFLEVYKHLENNVAQGYSSKEIITSEGKFELSYKGHYHTEKVNLSVDIANTNNKGSSDWYLAQLSKLSIDKKEIPNLIKQQLKVIKELYEIKPQYGKYYIFTSLPKVKVDDLREQILRLIEVSPEAKEVLEDSNAYTPNESIKVTENIISNLPSLSTYNLIIRNEILQKIEETLNEKRFVTVSAFAGTGKSTISIEYGSKQRDEAKKIVRFIYADSADKVLEAYRQLAKEFAIYTIGEKEEDIIRLVHERIANLKPSTLFIFDNVEKYKDIESYLNGIMNMPNDKTQVIITTRNNNLSEDITNIKLKPFNREEAILYLVESLKDRLNEQDISNLLAELSSEDAFILPYSLSEAVACLKENKLLKVNDYINYLQDSEDDHPGTVLLLQSLEKSPLAWLILQCSAHLDPDFISIDIFKELFLVNEEKLQEPIKRLEELSLMNLIRQNGQTGLQLHRLVQSTVKRYVDKHREHAIDKQKIYTSLAEALDSLFPYLTNVPNEDWENAKLLYPHIIKILNDDIKIYKLVKANLSQKIGKYNECVLCKFIDSLKFYKKALEIVQSLYQNNHIYIASSFNNVGIVYDKLGNTKKALKYYEEALNMFEGLHQGNHPNIADSLIRVGTAYQSLGNISKGQKYLEKALKMRKILHQGNHPDITNSLSNIGLAYGQLGDISKKLKYLEEVLKIRQALYQGNHPDIAASFTNIGVAYGQLGDISKGLKYFELALKMYSAIYQSNHPSTAGALNNIGLAYKKLGYISKGLRYLEEALRMKQKLYPNNHPDIASSFNNVGVAYDELGYISKGLKYKEASLKMYKAIYRGNHSSTADSLTNVGVTYDKLGNTTKALEYFELALKMYQALYKNDHPCIAGSLNNVGIAYEKLGYIPKGLKYKEEALKIYQRLYQANHPCIASSFSSIALSYKKSEDTNKAIELCKQAYLMYGQTLGLEHPNTKFIRSYLKTVTPEFIKNNETREFILQRGDFEEVILEIKQKIQKNILNKIFINAAKDKWNSKFSILGDWGVKGYLGDRYLAKQLGALANVKNIEIAKMLCFEAICLGAINSPSKNFACVKEFARAYPELTNKITNEHPEYFIDGSILRACINDEAILRKLLGSG